MVKRLLNFSYSYPKLVLILLLLLTVSVAPALQQLEFDISAQSLMVKSDPDWQAYQKSLQDFGSDSTVIIVLSDEKLYQRDNLLVIKNSLKNLNNLAFISHSSSLFNVPNVKEVDGYIESKPFLYELPETDQQSQNIIDEALSNVLVESNLVSPDRKTMAINLFIRSGEHYPGRDIEITQAIEQQLEPLKQNLSTVYQMSSPYVRQEISRQIQIDQESILPAALSIILLVLAVSMGRLNCAVVPLSSAAISIVMTLSFMAYMEIPINVLTSIIPALLIIIGSTEDVHLMAEYHSGIRLGKSRDESVLRLPVNQSMAVMLAFATTLVGFLSITVNDLELLRQFGWLMSFGLIVNFLVTTLFVPAYLRLFGGTGIGLEQKVNVFQRLAQLIFSIVIRLKKTTFFLLMLVTAYFIWGAQYLQVNNNTLAYFGKESEIHKRAQHIHESLSGMQTFSVILDSSIEGTFKKVRYLNDVEKLQQFIDQRGVFDKTFSFADFIKLTNQVMEDISEPRLPLDDDVVQVYMEFVQFDAVSSYVTQDFSSTRILVRHNIGSSNILKREFEAIEDFIRNDLKSTLKITLTGESVLNNNAADAMAVGQVQSLALMIVVIVFLVSLLFVDVRAGLIALIPNIFPVFVLFGVMGYFNIPLDTGTTMVAVIALGISVDDTIHFLSRYHFCTRGTDDVEQALKNTILHEATPITTTSIALALGFSALTLSSFQPVVYFGALSALVMVLAMFSTFVITPILLSFTRLITVWDMLSLNLKADVLKNSPLFKGMKSFQIKQAILSGIIRDFHRGDVIVDQGPAGDEFFVLLEGAATATTRDKDGSVHTLGYLKAGDLFGEVARLSKRDRIARVTANEKTRVLEMNWDSVGELARFHPRISLRLYKNLAEVLSKRFVKLQDDKSKVHDELTGAMTRPYLCEILKHEVLRSKHFTEDISLMLLDIDIVPTEGEFTTEQNDAIILAVTRVIQDYMRPIDIFARWGEFSFMVLLPRENSSYAVELAEKIENAIEVAEISSDAHLHITATVTEIKSPEKGQEAIDRLEKQVKDFRLNRKSLRIAVT